MKPDNSTFWSDALSSAYKKGEESIPWFNRTKRYQTTGRFEITQGCINDIGGWQ
jgi:hypothetical protein